MTSTKEVPLLSEVKKNIRALLISAPRGLSVDDIEHDYQAMLGKPLPYKHFKCKTPLEFLKTMPDVVSPTWTNGILVLKGIADESSRHIAKLVSRQRVNNSKSRRIFKAPISTKPLVVPNSFRKNIKELLSVYPNGVLGSGLILAYKRHYGEEINYSKLGFKSMSHLLNSIQDIATIVKNPRGGYRVCSGRKTPPLAKKSLLPAPSSQPNFPVTKTEPSVHSNSPPTTIDSSRKPYVIPSKRKPTNLNSLEGNATVRTDHDKRNIDKVKDMLDTKSGIGDLLKDELISVLEKRPNGVWAARLPFEYKTLKGKELNVLATGFYSVIEMASAMPDIFRIERPFPNGDWLLFLAAKTRKDKNITKVQLPENVIGKGVNFSQQSLPEEVCIEVYVTHIRTPDCFWIQLISHSNQLEKLQNDMQKFYSSKESAQLMVDDSFVRLGQVCVARFPVDHHWYRGLITAKPSQFVAIFYVDYGNSSQVSRSDLRLLKKEFFDLPSQAIKSKLANIKPKMTKWDSAAAHRMDALTANKGLIGFVSDKKDDVLSLCLCDTNTKDDIHVNNLLVDEHFAEWKEVTSGQTIPPGLPLPDPTQKELNQQITLNSLQQPSFPDYSMPLHIFDGYNSYPTYDYMSLMNMPLQDSPVIQEEAPPVIIDEEKPTDEDLEFMRQVCAELSDAVNVVVKRLCLPGDKIIHVINFEEKPFVVRSEISALLWESDVLRSMLRNAKVVVEKEIISREDHEELFKELRRLKVGDFAEGEEAKEYASLYPLSTVPGILETFNHPSPELVQMLRNEVAAFEESPVTYWGEESEEGTEESSQSEPEEEHDLEELKLAEQALQFARKRMLRAMMNGDLTSGENTVDKADDVEKRLAHIRKLIASAEAKETSKDTDGCKESKATLEDNVVQSDTMVNTDLLAQPEQQNFRPVGVTKPERRQPSPQNPELPTLSHPYPATSTHQYLAQQTSTHQSPPLLTSTPVSFNQENSGNPNVEMSVPLNTNIIPPNPLLVPQNPTDDIRSLMDVEIPPPTDRPSLSTANRKSYNDYVESTRKSMEKTSLRNEAEGNRESRKKFSWKKTTQGIVLQNVEKTQVARVKGEKVIPKKKEVAHGNHVTLPHQTMSGFPIFMPGGPIASMPQMLFPGAGVPPNANVPFQRYLGPLHPLPSQPYPDLGMHLNGPLSAPGFVSPSHLLFQYGSPFSNPNLQRSQR